VTRDASGRITRVCSMLPRHKAANWVSSGSSRKSTRPGGQSANYNDYDFGTDQHVPKTLYPFLGRVGSLANGRAAFRNLDPTTVRPVYACRN
jgi:hypothetical protein